MSKRGRIPDQISWFCKYLGSNFYRQLEEKLTNNDFKLIKIILTVSGYSNNYNLIVDGICTQNSELFNFRACFSSTNTSNPNQSIYELSNLIIERK